MTTISLAESEEQIRSCYPVMAELRPHVPEQGFVERVRRQQRESGYQLAFVEQSGAVRAVAGFRVAEFLAWGRTLYVDDLVTASAERSRGHGKALFDWLVALAKASGCAQLHLDSGVQRFDAHRFYLRNRMSITSHHFSLIVS
jgi:GNAT superfamily N-acetyltransferase